MRLSASSRHFRAVAAVALPLAAVAVLAATPPEAFDLVILGGTVVDGTGGRGTRADVGVKDGVIARVGRLRGLQAAQTIDATGRVVAPGFIDVHTHADDPAATPVLENFIRMGVTSLVAGNCGSSSESIVSELEAIRRGGITANFATLVGHNTVREAVLGTAQRAPDAGELARMKALVAKAMDEGAIGFSTGLQYVPGSYADREEIVELARVAGQAGGIYASHMRNEGTRVAEAITETIAVGEAAHCPVQISHLKIDSPNRWGTSGALLDMVAAARRRGVEVRADQYAYTAGSSGLSIRFPGWALEGGRAKIAERLNDPATWERIKGEMKALLAERGFTDLSWAFIAMYRDDPSLNGLSMDRAAARLLGRDDVEAQLETARRMLARSNPQMVYHFMSEEDVKRIMRDPDVMVASDSGVLTPGQGAPHPRGYGNNARVLARYVRESRTMRLEDAVRKMTSLPARQFGFARRGELRPGFAADIVVFDPAAVSDAATFEQPHQYAAGFGDVVVNGVAVIRNGTVTGARPGQVLRRTRQQASPPGIGSYDSVTLANPVPERYPKRFRE
jgi:N-acyl-D-amino-acid deacylase